MDREEAQYLADYFDECVERHQANITGGCEPIWSQMQTWRPLHNHEGERYQKGQKVDRQTLKDALIEHGIWPKHARPPKQ